MAGNFISRAARRPAVPAGTLLVIGAALTAVTGLLAAAGAGPATGTAAVVAWGLAYGGVSVSLQTWMLKAAPAAAEAATSLFVAAFNLSIALGALLGGLAVDGYGTAAALWLAAALLLPSTLVVLVTRPIRPPAARGPPARTEPPGGVTIMSFTITNPPALHDPVPFGYSHLATVTSGRLVLVAGQYASDDHGQVVSRTSPCRWTGPWRTSARPCGPPEWTTRTSCRSGPSSWTTVRSGWP